MAIQDGETRVITIKSNVVLLGLIYRERRRSGEDEIYKLNSKSSLWYSMG